jgi:hypothetical protein
MRLFTLFFLPTLFLYSTSISAFESTSKHEHSPDSIRHIEANFDGRPVLVRLPYHQGKEQFFPCTYLLKDGTVVYGECGGLHHTPHKGNELLRVQCHEPGKLYYEWFGDSVSYRQGAFMPATPLEARPIPYKIEYYDASYSQLIASFDLRADNPYTKEKMPQIEIEQHYEGEMGFGYPEPDDETAWLWTYTNVFFFDNGYTGITYRLFRQNANRALLGITTSISILDAGGKPMYKMSDVDLDIVPVLITQDGNHLATMLNTLVDVQDYPRRLGYPGIQIMDMRTGGVVFEEISTSQTGYFEGPFQRLSPILFFSKRDNMSDDSITTYVFIDTGSRTRYSGTFTKEQINSGVVSWSVPWEKIVESKYFTSSKF